MFVDHAGQTVLVTDRKTGEARPAYVFVAVLGASNYTYAEATWTRGLWDWISSHIRAFEFFDGVSRLVVPDNWRWKKARVSIDYHVDLERHYYSVPCQLVGKQVELRYTSSTVEVLHHGNRVASHPTQLPARRSHDKRRASSQIPSRVSGLDSSTHH